MFRDDRQIGEVARALLARVNLVDLWGEDGRPTARAVEFQDAGGGPLSAGQAVLLGFCFAMWNGSERRPMADLFRLDAGNLDAAGELLKAVAAGPEAVDTWLDEHRPRPQAAA